MHMDLRFVSLCYNVLHIYIYICNICMYVYICIYPRACRIIYMGIIRSSMCVFVGPAFQHTLRQFGAEVLTVVPRTQKVQ